MAEEERPGSCGWIDMDPPGARDRKRKKRFTEEQVKSLEDMFESQAKLDPRKKLQLAGELGLHPRQVAIWFQNKRARWKSKQMEREYGALRASYDALRSSFESLNKEKQVLTKQLQMLGEMPEERPEEKLKSGASVNRGEEDHVMVIQQPLVNISNFIEDDTETCTGPAVGGVSNDAAAEQQLGFRHSWPSDHQSCNSSQWWEFWPMNE